MNGNFYSSHFHLSMCHGYRLSTSDERMKWITWMLEWAWKLHWKHDYLALCLCCSHNFNFDVLHGIPPQNAHHHLRLMVRRINIDSITSSCRLFVASSLFNTFERWQTQNFTDIIDEKTVVIKFLNLSLHYSLSKMTSSLELPVCPTQKTIIHNFSLGCSAMHWNVMETK